MSELSVVMVFKKKKLKGNQRYSGYSVFQDYLSANYALSPSRVRKIGFKFNADKTLEITFLKSKETTLAENFRFKGISLCDEYGLLDEYICGNFMFRPGKVFQINFEFKPDETVVVTFVMDRSTYIEFFFRQQLKLVEWGGTVTTPDPEGIFTEYLATVKQ